MKELFTRKRQRGDLQIFSRISVRDLFLLWRSRNNYDAMYASVAGSAASLNQESLSVMGEMQLLSRGKARTAGIDAMAKYVVSRVSDSERQIGRQWNKQ